MAHRMALYTDFFFRLKATEHYHDDGNENGENERKSKKINKRKQKENIENKHEEKREKKIQTLFVQRI